MSDSVYGLENIIREKDAEIERLRAALQMCLSMMLVQPRYYDIATRSEPKGMHPYDRCVIAARKALDNNEQDGK